ncbi:MAG: alpha-galactosidase [Streptococcus sp.]
MLGQISKEKCFTSYLVYHLYDRLTTVFPSILFESCASGGGRFDPGLLYYTPLGPVTYSAVERLKINRNQSSLSTLDDGAHVLS